MTKTADMQEEAKYIQRIFKNIVALRKQLQKQAIDSMARGENVNEMMEVLRITKEECIEDDE